MVRPYEGPIEAGMTCMAGTGWVFVAGMRTNVGGAESRKFWTCQDPIEQHQSNSIFLFSFSGLNLNLVLVEEKSDEDMNFS